MEHTYFKEDVSLESSNRLEISTKTLRFGDAVYQIKNITGADVSRYRFSRGMPGIVIIICFILGLLSAISIDSFENAITPLLLLFTGSFGLIQKALLEKTTYVLVLEFNSGAKRYFESSRKSFLEDVVHKLYEIMDNPDEKVTYIVNIKAQEIKTVHDHRKFIDKSDRSNRSININDSDFNGSPINTGSVRDMSGFTSHSNGI